MVKRILSFYTKYFAIWVLVFGVIAYLFPAGFVALRDYNKLFFGLTMFGIGAVLEVADFKRIAQRPTIILIGSAAQFSIMPLGAFVLAKLFDLPPEIRADKIASRGEGEEVDSESEEREEILQALEGTHWNRTEAAKKLGISRVTLWKRMKKHHIRGS